MRRERFITWRFRDAPHPQRVPSGARGRGAAAEPPRGYDETTSKSIDNATGICAASKVTNRIGRGSR